MGTISDDDREDVPKPPPAKPKAKVPFIPRKKLYKKADAPAALAKEDGKTDFWAKNNKKNFESLLRAEQKQQEEDKRKEEEEKRLKQEIPVETKTDEKKKKKSKSASISPVKKRKSVDHGQEETVGPSRAGSNLRTRGATNSRKKSRSSEDSEDDCKVITTRKSINPTYQDDGDDELKILDETTVDLDPELAARVRARKAMANKAVPKDTTAASQSTTSSAPRTNFEPDTIIQVLIISMIPGTEAKIINAKLNTGLGRARLKWVEHQNVNFTEEQLSRLILVWRNTLRIYDFTTCAGLKVKARPSGSLFIDEKGWERKAASYSGNQRELDLGVAGTNKIVFEAMWESDFEERKREVENALLAGEYDSPDISLADNDDDSPQDASENTGTILVKLRGKSFQPLHLKVPMTCLVSELVTRLREERDLHEAKITILFEGDNLDEEDNLQDIGIEDEEILDVLVK